MDKEKAILKMKEAGFPDEIIASIMDKGKQVKLKNKELLLQKGKVCKAMFFVLKGSFLSQYIDEATGNTKTVNFFSESYSPVMTAPKSYHRELPSKVQLKAIEDSEVIVMNKTDIDYDITYKISPTFKDFYIQCLINQLIRENEFKIHIITKTPKQLYQYLITEHPKIIEKFPSKNIAEFMGITAEWLSKLKKSIFLN